MTLRQFLADLKAEGDLRHISVPVSTDQELAALTRREFLSSGGGRVLCFERPVPGKFAVVSNLFGSARRMNRVLACSGLEAFEDRLADFLARGRGDAAERIAAQVAADPLRTVANPFSEGADLADLPALRSWPGEGEPYLTLALTVTCDPEVGRRNIGLYRAQIKNDGTIALNFSPSSGAAQHLASAKRQGALLPVCLILGCDPLLTWAAAAPLPSNCDEIGFCRSFFQVKAPLTEAMTQPLLIPANGEIVIEGEVDPQSVTEEGPFGNHTGQYVSRPDCPVMRVTAVRHRPEAIVPVTVVGPPPSENIWLGAANEVVIRRMLAVDYPDIARMFMPRQTLFHGVTLMTLSAGYSGTVRQLVERLWQTGPLKHARLMIFFDDDIDPAEMDRCWWRTVNRIYDLKVYQRAGRTAIDATGLDPRALVGEDSATRQLLARRQQEPGYPHY